MKGKIRIVSVGAAILALSGICSANGILGSLALNGGGVSQNGADLSASTTISDTSSLVLSAGSGDYSPVAFLTDYGPSTLDLTNFTSFTLNNATYGSFAATSGVIVTQTANFLDVFLTGLYTPGPGLALGLDPTTSSLRFSINQSGSSLSEAITLNSPALSTPGVPEPGTGGLLLLGGSLTFLGMFSRRFRSGCRQ